MSDDVEYRVVEYRLTHPELPAGSMPVTAAVRSTADTLDDQPWMIKQGPLFAKLDELMAARARIAELEAAIIESCRDGDTGAIAKLGVGDVK